MLPLDDRARERFNAALAGRPDLLEGRTEMTVYEGMKGIPENGFINIKNRSFVITADIEIPKGGAEGVVIAQGGEMGGWSLYVKNGDPGSPTTSSSRDFEDRWTRSPAIRKGDAPL